MATPQLFCKGIFKAYRFKIQTYGPHNFSRYNIQNYTFPWLQQKLSKLDFTLSMLQKIDLKPRNFASPVQLLQIRYCRVYCRPTVVTYCKFTWYISFHAKNTYNDHQILSNIQIIEDINMYNKYIYKLITDTTTFTSVYNLKLQATVTTY